MPLPSTGVAATCYCECRRGSLNQGAMFDGHSLLSGLTTAIAVLGLFIVLEQRVIAAIRFGKTVMAEVGFLKSLDFHIAKGVIRSHPAPAVLARAGCHPDPIDPHVR